ncbi:hypothetical protein WMY93_009699 [Mugilogobius chulae]|uniref:receptor protein-tyrosine kinase n=1 Tax=Mugilogobius chulae TaxID=88201 RepID=A0AAW0PHC4_9GOBI
MRSATVSPLQVAATVFALLYLCPRLPCLEITPADRQFILDPGSSLTLTCSGSEETAWEFQRDDVPYFQVDQVQHGKRSFQIVQNNDMTSVMTLFDVSWKHSGTYLCIDHKTGESQEAIVFVPDSDVWFIESSHGMVIRTGEESTIPCLVTNPNISVSLFEKDTDVPVRGVYDPSGGFRAPVEERTYVCHGELNGEVKESQAFYVYSVAVPETLDPYINASKTVLKEGDPLTVNCTVHGVELVFFSWDIPNRESTESSQWKLQVSCPRRGAGPKRLNQHQHHRPGTWFCEGETCSPAKHFCKVARKCGAASGDRGLSPSSGLLEERWFAIRGDKTIVTRQEQEIRYVSVLTLVRVRTEQKGLYTALVTNGDDTKELLLTWSCKIKDLSDHPLPGKRHLVTCLAEGVPTPFIKWYSCDSILNVVPQVAVLAAVLALIIIIIMSFIILIAVWRKKPRYEIRWKVIESVSQDGHEYIYVDPIHLPYDLIWEMPRDHLVLGRTLGSGAFGRVVEATAYGLTHSQSSTKVAVKMLKSTARRSETQALMSELKIMSHLGPHLNIVNLLGACTKHGPLYLVTEYCRYGDLVDYLHRNKHTFLQYYAEKNQDSDSFISRGSTPLSQRKAYVSFGSESDGGYMDMTKDEPSMYVPMHEQNDTIKYADIQPSPYEATYQQDIYQEQVCPSRSRCQKCIICEGKLVKICDFGLARDIMHDSNYISKGSTFLPLKWMAPESIFHNLYTTLSDVWSYGILLWEILPWKYNQVNDNFMKSEHPAVVRAKPRLSSPFPASSPMFGSSTPLNRSSPLSHNPVPRTFRHQQTDDQDALPSYNDYIIPIPDPKPDDAFTDVLSESPGSSLALEEVETDSVDTADTLPEEDRLEGSSERDALLGRAETPEVEDSFL